MASLFPPPTKATITPRPYQTEDVINSFKQWDAGQRGTLTRAFTGAGKTICACLKIERWLDRGDDYKAMIISYERQLCWQFSDEVHEVLGIKPSIEMQQEQCLPGHIPRIVVASRATLLPWNMASEEQKKILSLDYGLGNLEVLPERAAMSILRQLDKGMPPETAQQNIDELARDYRANHELKSFSRLYKFDWQTNWLVIFDEAHKHAHKLKSVGHITDWFDRNPNSRRNGLTATPKRSDNVCIGHRLFPSISLDYPLKRLYGPNAVDDGWAVAYKQRFIAVSGVDFRQIGRIGNDLDEHELEDILGQEAKLAEVIEPLLDMVDDRQTLIFSPGVEMAKQVALYINARVKYQCTCGTIGFCPARLVGDGAKCRECKEWVIRERIVSAGTLAKACYGTIPAEDRKAIYYGHQTKDFQFLSVCALCREGYNDVGISCVAIFRPVTQKASALAEQMKGRGCRPLKGVVEGLETKEERKQAIAQSEKPDCLIVDLVGVTGLADCASTVHIYAEGEPDEVIDLANRILQDRPEDDGDVDRAIRQAKEEIAKEREEAAKREQEFARRRAIVDVDVTYTTHDVGDASYRKFGDRGASEKQIKYIGHLGLDCSGYPITKNQAGRIINQLKAGVPVDEVKYTNGLPAEMGAPPATANQVKYLMWKNIPVPQGLTKAEASQLIDRHKNPQQYPKNEVVVGACKMAIDGALTASDLDGVARSIKQENLSPHDMRIVVEYGRKRREEINEF
jgi:superfamily II DNA or RNA helicase